MDRNKVRELFDKYCKKLRIVPGWDIRLEFVEDPVMHIKMYPLDQVTESLTINNFEEGSKASNFAYQQFLLPWIRLLRNLPNVFYLNSEKIKSCRLAAARV